VSEPNPVEKFKEIVKIVLRDRGYTTDYIASYNEYLTFAGHDKYGYRSLFSFSKREIEMNADNPHAVVAIIQNAFERNEDAVAELRWIAERNARAVMAINPPPHPNSKLAKLMVKIGETRLAPLPGFHASTSHLFT
jgi:hypothetical protein